jgi:hypothetical protein
LKDIFSRSLKMVERHSKSLGVEDLLRIPEMVGSFQEITSFGEF